MTGNRYGDAPLGKSVEEVEQESGNRENPAVTGEQARANDDTVVPAVMVGNSVGVPAIVDPDSTLARNTDAGGAGADTPDNRERTIYTPED